MNVFYCEDINHEITELSPEESGHAIRVLRLKTGDSVLLTNGKGNLVQGSIVNAHPKKCEISVLEPLQNSPKHSYYLHLALAPVKSSDRFEWFLEKAVELGVDRISPLICANSERLKINQERSLKVLVSAMKQSMNLYLPVLDEPISFKKFMEEKHLGTPWITHCRPGPKQGIGHVLQSGREHVILIGPEGDFTSDEINLALHNGYRELSLGQSRLRTETAGIYTCAALRTLFEG